MLNNSDAIDGVDDAIGEDVGDAVGDAIGENVGGRETAPLGFRMNTLMAIWGHTFSFQRKV